MPFFGAHMSIAGGVHNGLLAAKKYDCTTVQLFTASPQMWHVRQPPARQAVF
jgi:deoxyribonuclease-4